MRGIIMHKEKPAPPDRSQPALPEGSTSTRRAKLLSAPPERETRGLLHELEVHQVELEMQNEELRAARLETESALARYTELFDFAPIGYATVSIDGSIREVNFAGAQLLGRPRARLIGTKLCEGLGLRGSVTFSKLMADAMASGVRQSCELEFVGTGARPVQVHVTANLLPRAEPRILLALEDITERKLHETKLALTEQALREADRRKDEFLAVLSHELRNPLAPIRNSVFVLARAEPGGERARKAQIIIDRQVTHLTRLIDDLLDVTRIARGKIELQRSRIELTALARRTLDDHRTSFEAMGIELVDECRERFLWVDADPARLVQVLSNLLGNALKFTPRGGRVTVRLEQRDLRVKVCVSDTGTGIDPSTIPHLFVPFAQAPQSVDRPRGGLGLGLAMVKGLIELHGGTARITSPGLGLGTEVTFFLPLQTAPSETPSSSAPLSMRRRRVLVIEDHLDASETLREALELSGHDVRTAHDGPSGIELARSFCPEVVICDIGLPGMDGYAVAQAFRADAQLDHAVLVALSGYAQPEDLQRATQAGFDRHLAKPATLEDLERLLTDAPALLHRRS